MLIWEAIFKYNDRLDFHLHHAILSESADVTTTVNTNIHTLREVTMSEDPPLVMTDYTYSIYIYGTHCLITQCIIKQHEFLPTYIVHLITRYVLFFLFICFRCANSFHLLKEPDAGSCKIELTGTVTYIHAWTSEWKGDVILSGSYRTYNINSSINLTLSYM